MALKAMTTATLVSALALATPLAAQDTTGQTDTTTTQSENTAPKDLTAIKPTPGLTADKVTDMQVASFVDALVAIERVRVTYMPKIQATADDTARTALIDQANAAVVKAVDGVENMTVSDYIAIDKAAQENGDLNDRIMAEIAEMRDDAENETTTQ